MTSILTGVAFGAALTASGVFLPSVILGQLKWDNYHMLEAFLTATASSTLIVAAANRLGYIKTSPRTYADRGLISGLPYDGNLIGGFALGAGMALAGACPGTVLAQAALNIRTGYYALGGGLVGGTVWSALLRPALQKIAAAQKKAAEEKKTDTTPAKAPLATSLPALLGVPPSASLAGFELVLAGIVGASVYFAGPGPDAVLPPVAGGLLIGLSQLFSVLVRKSLLGVSTVYEDVGDWLLWTVPSSKKGEQKKTPSTTATLFALGVVAGAWGIVQLFPHLTKGVSTAVVVAPATAVVGGFLMAIGSRVAGGCTSGHGISGMSLLSVSSLITMGSAFAGGTLVALFL